MESVAANTNNKIVIEASEGIGVTIHDEKGAAKWGIGWSYYI